MIQKALQRIARKFMQSLHYPYLLKPRSSCKDIMSKSESSQTKSDEFYDKLKENYILRTQECDNFSKRISNACVDVNTESLYGALNLIQQYVGLQKKYAHIYPVWYNYDAIIKQSKIITEAWNQSVQYLDSFYVESLKYTKNNLRSTNSTLIQVIQNTGRFYDIYQKMDLIQEDKSERSTSSKHVVIKKESNQS